MGTIIAIITAGKTGKGDFIIASVPQANFERLFAYQIQKEGFPLLLLPFLKIAAKIELGMDYQLYNPDRWVSKISKPTLFISANRDRDVNSEDAVLLYTLANKPKSLWRVDSGHDVFAEKSNEFEENVINFLDEYTQ